MILQDIVSLVTNEQVLVNYTYSGNNDDGYFIEIEDAVLLKDDGEEGEFDIFQREEELKEALVYVIEDTESDNVEDWEG